MQTKAPFLALFTTALLSAGVATLLTLAYGSGRSTVADPRAQDDSFAPLLAELKRLNDNLARRGDVATATAPAATVAASADRELVADADGERFDALVDRLDRLLVSLQARPLSGRDGGSIDIDPRVREQGERWDRLDQLCALHRADPAAARRSILFLTAREVVQRFGIPTHSGSGKGNMWMAYRREAAQGSPPFNLYLSFADGIVMLYEIELD